MAARHVSPAKAQHCPLGFGHSFNNEGAIALRDVREEQRRLEKAQAELTGLDAREAGLQQLSAEVADRGAWLTIAEQGLDGREAQAADLERAVERRQRALDLRESELERFEQSLNAREQALDSAEGDLEQRRRRLFVSPEPSSA